MRTSTHEVVVIGAGAAGLGAAREIRRRGVEVRVLEAAARAGGSWRSRYTGLKLNTVRLLSSQPGMSIPRSAGRWLAGGAFADYLEQYASKHRLPISFAVEVSRIERDGDHWSLQSTAGVIRARCVVVATGYDRVPKLPTWPGRATFEGSFLHASRYKAPGEFRGREVLVIGAGNSGTEIATQLASHATRVDLSIRTPVNLMPAEFLGVPSTFVARLSEGQPRWLVDRMGSVVQRLAFGDLSRYGLQRAPYGIATELRLKGLGPVLDRGFVAALKEGRIRLVAAVEGFEGPEVQLRSGDKVRPNTVIAATGYRHGLEALVGHLGVLDASGRPHVLGADTHPGAPRLYFNGFWLPLSGQLPAMRRSAKQIGRAVKMDCSPPRPRKIGRKSRRGGAAGGRGSARPTPRHRVGSQGGMPTRRPRRDRLQGRV